MDILDEIKAVQEPEKKCGLKDALLSMSEKDQAKVLEALTDRKTYESKAIAQVLIARGHRVNRSQIGRCRNRCSCGQIPIPLPKELDG